MPTSYASVETTKPTHTKNALHATKPSMSGKPIKYPCKGCVEKYTNQYNEMDRPGEICPLCIEIACRKQGIDLAQPGSELSTIAIVGLDKNGGLEYTEIIPKGENPRYVNYENIKNI